MRLNPFCMCCIINRQEKKIRSFKDEEKKAEYMKQVLRLLADSGPDDCTASLAVDVQKAFEAAWDVHEDLTPQKHEFNQLMLDLEDSLRSEIRNSPDPLETAMIYARIGNYIDFSALAHVDREEMLSLIRSENKDPLDPEEYARLKEDLKAGSSLVYLTDNCGEIVLDKLVVEILKEQYPHLAVTVIVRGYPAANDATMEDAREAGLDRITQVIGNGSDVGGTWLPGISKEARSLLYSADVILSKGQGNFETLHECGLNIYYLFLCKCEWFTTRFHARRLQGMLVNEKRIGSSS